MLTDDISTEIRMLKITSLDVSFNELCDMYNSGELIIDPNYQRTFRWDLEKQSRFIESLLLEMPIPPIYAIEVDDGKYELIDGLQRISSYLSFRGVLIEEKDEPPADERLFDQNSETDLEDDDNTQIQNGFALTGCDIITSLNNMTYSDLPTSLQIKAKRAFVRMDVLRKGINPEMKYHMFKRLNTGGEKLSAQELRNCSLRLISNKFIDYVNEMAKNEDFRETIRNVSIKQIKKKFAEELVVRFFAFKNDSNSFSHDIDKFLTRYMEKVSFADEKGEPIFDYEKETLEFINVFKWLKESIGRNAFAVYKGKSNKLSGFNVYQFEAVTAGVFSLYQVFEKEFNPKELKRILEEAKKNEELISSTVGGGKNSAGVYNNRVEILKRILGAHYVKTDSN